MVGRGLYGALLLAASSHACGASQRATPTDGVVAPSPNPQATPPEAPASTQQILDRCTAGSVRPGNAVLFCEGFQLWVVQPINEAPEIVLERIRRTHVDTSRGAATRETTIRVLGKEFPATEYDGLEGQHVVFGRVSSADGAALIGSCVSSREGFERCQAALEEVARNGFPAYAKPPAGPAKIGERVLEMPPQCTQVGNNRMRCPASELHWGEAHANSEGFADFLQRGLERLGSVTRSSAQCKLLDVPTLCHVYRVARAEGPMTVAVGVATTPAGTFFAQCNCFDTRLGLTPPPCNQILVVSDKN